MIRRLLCLAALALAPTLVLSGCDDDPVLNTERDTLSDPIADIATLGGYLFTTNEDWSGHAGSQVDLFKFTVDGFPEGRFDLGLNGVGYLAATADRSAIYLQARDSGLLIKVTPVGEIAWTRGDPYADSRHLACGLAYRADLDSFVTLYHEPGTANYTARHHGPDFAGDSGPLPACGLAPADDGLRVAYPDRRFELLPLDGHEPDRTSLLEDAASATDAQVGQH